MKQKMQQWLVRPQGKLGPLGLVVLLVAASLVTPLSLDMYTPAVPHMTEAFDTTAGTVNLTLVGYFLFFAVGLLVFGPLSDRYGRRPVLLAVSTNDGLSGSAANLGALLARRHFYFVPFGQDSPTGKPASLVAHFSLLPEAAEAALRGEQLQPLLV